MKEGPGVAAKPGGKRLAAGRALKVMIYPRPKTKAVLVKAASLSERPLSNFMLISALERVARLDRVKVKDLIPKDEYEQLYGTSRKIAGSMA